MDQQKNLLFRGTCPLAWISGQIDWAGCNPLPSLPFSTVSATGIHGSQKDRPDATQVSWNLWNFRALLRETPSEFSEFARSDQGLRMRR